MRIDVELIDEWRRATEETLRLDGYMVTGAPDALVVGSTLNEDSGIWKVVGEATYEDALRQFERNKKFLTDGEDFIPPPKNYRFYKVVPEGGAA